MDLVMKWSRKRSYLFEPLFVVRPLSKGNIPLGSLLYSPCSIRHKVNLNRNTFFSEKIRNQG